MSDFESEHDTDSEPETNIEKEDAGKGNNGKDVLSSKADIDEEGRQIGTDIAKESNNPNRNNEYDADDENTKQDVATERDVADITEDFLAELKEASEKPKKNKDKEPWQLYLQQAKEASSYTYEDPNDGTVYEWDEEKRAWFPKIDEDFIAAYQATYGFTETGEPLPPEALAEAAETEVPDSKEAKAESGSKTAGQKRKAEDPAWFDINPEKNYNVYVSGLPLDITEEEFAELMGKCGIIMEDSEAQKTKVKLYKDDQGKNKGDGRCCYLRGESVPLALQLLDESEYRGHKIKVEQAVFQQKGDFNPSLKPKKNKKKKKKKKPGKGQDKLLDWVDRDGKRSKFDRIVILKNMFDSKEFEKEPQMIFDLKQEITTECEKFGIVKKVMIFDRNPDGVCSILYQEPEMADECIAALNGRWFGGLRIIAETYDGKANYQVTETEEEREKRIKEWENFLSNEDTGNEDNKTDAQQEPLKS